MSYVVKKHTQTKRKASRTIFWCSTIILQQFCHYFQDVEQGVWYALADVSIFSFLLLELLRWLLPGNPHLPPPEYGRQHQQVAHYASWERGFAANNEKYIVGPNFVVTFMFISDVLKLLKCIKKMPQQKTWLGYINTK